MDDVGGSDVSSEAVRGAFAPDASSAETRPGGESGSGGSARGHSETYSDDFGSGDDGISEDGAFLNDPVDDAPESPAGKAPSHPGAFATTGDPSAPEEKRQGVHSATRNAPPRASSFAAAPARTAAGLGFSDARAPSEGAAPDPGRSGASSPRVFRWERSPSPDSFRRDAAAETGKTTGEDSVETRRRTDPAWASVPGRVAALVARARAVSARREAVAAMSPAARAQRRFENDPADRRRRADDGQGARNARRRRSGPRRRRCARASRRTPPRTASAPRRSSRALCTCAARSRAAALEGARVAEDLERERDDVSGKGKDVFDARGFARRAPRRVRGRGRGRGRSRKPGGARVVSPLGKGKQALLRRLWASHRLRRAAAECVGGARRRRWTRRRASGRRRRWDARRAARTTGSTRPPAGSGKRSTLSRVERARRWVGTP